MSDLEASIRDLISQYVAGDIDVAELNDRLPDGWDLDEADDPGATELALLALGFLAGYQSGARDEDALRSVLARLITDMIQIEYETDNIVDVLASRVATTIQVVVEGDSSLAEGFEREPAQHPQTEHRTTTALPDLQETH